MREVCDEVALDLGQDCLGDDRFIESEIEGGEQEIAGQNRDEGIGVEFAGFDESDHGRARDAEDGCGLFGGEVLRGAEHERSFTVGGCLEHLGESVEPPNAERT